jgi:hypothetical protein
VSLSFTNAPSDRACGVLGILRVGDAWRFWRNSTVCIHLGFHMDLVQIEAFFGRLQRAETVSPEGVTLREKTLDSVET